MFASLAALLIAARIAYADSVSAVSADSYRLSNHPAYVAAFRRSLALIGGLPCNLILTPHPGASELFQRLSRGSLTGPTACRDYASQGATRLDARLQREATR